MTAATAQSSAPTIGVIFVEVEGPLEVTPDRMPESYRRVIVAHPSATVAKAQAAEQIIRNFASKAYRRPVTDDEVKQLMALWSKFDTDTDSFESSIDGTLQAVLASPNFLYRYERDPDSSDPSGVRTLDEYELASRLSYFLWSSMPDDELFSRFGREEPAPRESRCSGQTHAERSKVAGDGGQLRRPVAQAADDEFGRA